jgi:hypothetical protein
VRRWPALYPFLFALVGILSDYAVRPGLSLGGEIARVVLVGLAVVAAVFLPSLALFRDQRKSALAALGFLVVYFAYGDVHAALTRKWVSVTAGHAVLAVVALLLVAWLGRRLARMRMSLVNLTALLNVVALGFLMYPVGRLVWFYATHRLPGPAAVELVAARAPTPLPDIYYIILDHYGDHLTLEHHFGHDNLPFYERLEQRGFFVARESFANYPRTAPSLASSLNLDYLDDLAAAGADSGDWRPMFVRLRDHAVGRFLAGQGYRQVHLGTWWWPTAANPHADENLNCYHRVPYPFARLLTERTLLQPLARATGWTALDTRRQQWARERWKFDRLEELPGAPGPKFVFAHFLLPHDPFVADAEGGFLSVASAEARGLERNFREQVLYVNRRIEQFLDRALADSAVPPVIIFQADEGPPPLRYRRLGRRFQWSEATAAEIRHKTAILNALYLPGVDTGRFHPRITPVNTFRIVLDHLFGAGLAPLDDRVYLFESDDRPYRFRDVTALVRAETARLAGEGK